MTLDTEYTFGPFRLHPASRQLTHGDDPVRLGARAFDLLHALVVRAGEPLSKDELLAQVWRDTVVDEGSLRVHMAALRKALGDAATNPTYIANLPQRGYCFVAPVAVRAVNETVPPPAPPAAASTTAFLPLPSVRLVGRDDVIDAVAGRLGRQRLVTLVGPGGIGKTSVALAVAARLQAGFADGACFVDLASLSEPTLVVSTLAAALGVPVLG
ncbi:MAG: winged helix-turn-helix domain-containing protein, partial [Rhizobacter sp.]